MPGARFFFEYMRQVVFAAVLEPAFRRFLEGGELTLSERLVYFFLSEYNEFMVVDDSTDIIEKEDKMNLLDAILNGGGSPVSQMVNKFGVSEDQVTRVIQQFLPALTNGVKQNVSQKGGLEGLLSALKTGNHDRYLDNPDALEAADAVDDGNDSPIDDLLGMPKKLF